MNELKYIHIFFFHPEFLNRVNLTNFGKCPSFYLCATHEYTCTQRRATVPTCLSVSICPTPPSPSDRYTDYGYRVNSHLRRVKKKKVYTQNAHVRRSLRHPPPPPPPPYGTSPSHPTTLFLSDADCVHVSVCMRVYK